MITGNREKIKREAANLMSRGSNGAHEEIKRCSKAAINWNIGNHAWCACTVSVIFYKAGLLNLIYPNQQVTCIMSGGKLTHKDKGTPKEREWVRSDHDLGKYGVYKTLNTSNRTKLLKSLRTGDLVIFKNGISHIGIFVKYNERTNRLTTIEGNAKDAGEGGVRGYSNNLSRTLNKVSGFVIPRFNDNSNVSTGGDNKEIITLDSPETPGVSVYPRIAETSTELKESNISDSERMWVFYTNTAYKNYNSQVPVGLNPVKKTLGSNTSSIHDMSIMKNNYLGYVVGRSLEVWDNPQNGNFEIVNNKSSVENANSPLVFCKGNDKWYLSQRYINIIESPENPEEEEMEKVYKYAEYDTYSNMPTPFNLYFGDVDNSNPINWNNITTPEKLLIRIVKNNSSFNYEPAFTLEDENDVKKGFKKVSGKNTPNDNCKAKVGSIAVWANGSISSNRTGMIMGFVEKVKSDNKILVSWSNPLAFFYSTWLNPYALANGSDILSSSTGADTRNRINNSGFYFWGYIYPPDGANIFQNGYFLTAGSAAMNWTTERIWVI